MLLGLSNVRRRVEQLATLLRSNLVEVPGVEPGSRNASKRTSTSIARCLFVSSAREQAPTVEGISSCVSGAGPRSNGRQP